MTAFKISAFLFLSLFSFPAYSNIFLVKENNTTWLQEGNIHQAYSPCSTFKIAISLMGYEEGMLLDTHHPQITFKQGYADDIESWKQTHNPSLWMKNSCVWYSQVIVKQIGKEKFKEYLDRFEYGNQDISGSSSSADAYSSCWLTNSLKISPEQQVRFIEHIVQKKYHLRPLVYSYTKKILFYDLLDKGWKLYGKTGNGSYFDNKKKKQLGWFVGWLEKNNRKICFAKLITDDEDLSQYASLKAKEFVIHYFKQVINNQTWLEEAN